MNASDPNTLTNPSLSAAGPLPNGTDGIYVVCSFPISDQYGLGSRLLFYVLVGACIFARNLLWLREACLAGALLLPLVAGLHGIVLAIYHVDGELSSRWKAPRELSVVSINEVHG